MPYMQDTNNPFGLVLLRLNNVEQEAIGIAASPPRRTVVNEASDLDVVKSIFGRYGMDAG